MMLSIISEKHDRWLQMAYSMCKDVNLSNDLVQDMYLRIDSYVYDESKVINEDGTINEYYIYVVLRNVYYKWFNNRKKMDMLEFCERDILDNISDEYICYTIDDDMDVVDMENAFERMMSSIEDEVKDWHWYNQKLFRLYFLTDMTMRDLAEETKISLTSIYNSIKNYKEIMREKFSEDIEDYFNQDYDKL